MAPNLTARLVRLQDRFSLRSAPVWRVNKRTGALEARAGLSWTGVREYKTGNGIIRVLRRPAQVNSPAHLRTLHRLTATEGHPAGDVDVSPFNADELGVGAVGDAVTVEEHNGYPRPVGNVSVLRPSTIAKMVEPSIWRQYQELFEESRKIEHGGGPALTGTSLGYNALWYGPHIDAEIVGERDNDEGGVDMIGEWQGPHGPERYDIEHIVDPTCEIVQRLVRDQDFDPEQLGGNHFAVALPYLGGRGAQQSEMMRIVDSRDVIAGAPARSRVSVALHRVREGQARDAMKWAVGAERDLPIAESGAAWDGDAAAASLFAAAGWPDKPDAARARRGFLIYDANEPELKGSYKLPFARVREGRLEVLASGLRAAASRLPQTDAPREVLDRARDVLDHYFGRLEGEASDNADESNNDPEGQPTMSTATTPPTQVVDFGKLSRDASAKLRKRGLALPTALSLTLDMVDAPKAREMLGQMNELIEELMKMLAETEDANGEAKESMANMEESMKDMMTKEEAQALVDEMKAKLAEAEEKLAEAAKTSDALKKANDSLTGELEPLRKQQLADLAAKVLATGDAAFNEEKVKACKDVAELRRLVVAAKVPALAKAGDAAVGAAFDMFAAQLPAPTGNESSEESSGSNDDDGDVNETAQGRDGNSQSSSLSSLPRIEPGRGRDSSNPNETPADAPKSTAHQIGRGLSMLG